jgi:hypothetical protein
LAELTRAVAAGLTRSASPRRLTEAGHTVVVAAVARYLTRRLRRRRGCYATARIPVAELARAVAARLTRAAHVVLLTCAARAVVRGAVAVLRAGGTRGHGCALVGASDVAELAAALTARRATRSDRRARHRGGPADARLGGRCRGRRAPGSARHAGRTAREAGARTARRRSRLTATDALGGGHARHAGRAALGAARCRALRTAARARGVSARAALGTAPLAAHGLARRARHRAAPERLEDGGRRSRGTGRSEHLQGASPAGRSGHGPGQIVEGSVHFTLPP